MEIYVQKPGLGNGPYLMFQIREMLADGRLSPEDIAWHEGQAEWLPITGMESLRHVLPTVVGEGPAQPPPLVESDVPVAMPPELPATVTEAELKRRLAGLQLEHDASRYRHGWVWRRFWARTLDLGLFIAVLWTAGWQFGILDALDFALIPTSLKLTAYALWVLVEALMLNTWGTTPGKALLGLRVVDETGNLPTMPTALKRSAGVWFHGVAFGLDLAQIIFQLFGMRRFLKFGSTVWDTWAETSVQARPMGILPILSVICAVLAWHTCRVQALFSVPHDQLPLPIKELLEPLERMRRMQQGVEPAKPAPAPNII